MKVGDEFNLDIEGKKVGTARIVAVNSDNTVEMKFDGGRAVFQTKTYIDVPPAQQGAEHALLGVEENLSTQGQANEVNPAAAISGEGTANVQTPSTDSAQPTPEAQPSPAAPVAAPVTPVEAPVNTEGDTVANQNETVQPEVSKETPDNS